MRKKPLAPRRAGTTQLLKSIGIGKSRLLDPKKVSSVNNLHSLAARNGLKIATRTTPAGKLKVFRLE